jgi:hypothetical protein
MISMVFLLSLVKVGKADLLGEPIIDSNGFLVFQSLQTVVFLLTLVGQKGMANLNRGVVHQFFGEDFNFHAASLTPEEVMEVLTCLLTTTLGEAHRNKDGLTFPRLLLVNGVHG